MKGTIFQSIEDIRKLGSCWKGFHKTVFRAASGHDINSCVALEVPKGTTLKINCKVPNISIKYFYDITLII
jgi:hypothetical protein